VTISAKLKNVSGSKVRHAIFTLLDNCALPTVTIPIEELLKLIVTEESSREAIELCVVLIPVVVAFSIVT
jgi:hypothetical protein